MIRISINTLKDDIDTAFQQFGAEIAYGRNWKDIHSWKKQGFIDYEEEKSLLAYNRIRHAEESAKGNY